MAVQPPPLPVPAHMTPEAERTRVRFLPLGLPQPNPNLLASSSLSAVSSRRTTLSSPPYPHLHRPSSSRSHSILSMAPVASSSSPSGSRLRPPKDSFKPKFPLDPFSGHSAAALGEPWFLKIDALLNATAFQRRNVIFVIGAPSLAELGPLLQSHQLAKSLVILATHKPPDIPGVVYPTVRILRLTLPLALEDTGAVRFVNVLEWAERVSRTWRKQGGAGVVELLEECDINGSGDLKPPSVFRFGSHSTPPSPGNSTTNLTGKSSAQSSRSSSRPPSIASMLYLNTGSASLPPSDPSQRPFDALVNFLPEKISDKALLKNAILVTTISRPFLKPTYGGAASSIRTRATSSSSPSSSPRPARPRSIFGAFSRSSSSLSVYIPSNSQNLSRDSLPLSPASTSASAPLGKALLVHLLPSPHPKEPPEARRRLVDSLETFLLSFSFHSAPGMQSQTPTFPSPARTRTSTYSPGTASRPVSGMWPEPEADRARAYLMHATTFCDAVGPSDPSLSLGSTMDCGEGGEWTVADVVLSGALDADNSVSVDPLANGPVTPLPTVAGADPAGKLRLTRRAWIAAAADLVIVPAGPGHECSPSTSHGIPRAHGQVPGAALPSRTTRSSSAPLLSAEWGPANASSGGRPLSLSLWQSPSQPQAYTHRSRMEPPPPVSAPPAAVTSSSRSSSSSSSSDPGSGSTPSRLPMSNSVNSTPESSLGPRTPPPEEESGSESQNCGDADAGRTASGMGLAVAVSVPDGSAKVAKWKFWRRKAGANAAEVGA